MGEAKRIAAFRAERDKLLAAADLDGLEAFALKHNQRWAPNRQIAEMAMHKAITACVNLDIEHRRKSKRWLLERGLMSHDDGDL